MNKKKLFFRFFIIAFIFTIILTNLGCKSCKDDEDEEEKNKDIIVTLYKTTEGRGATLSTSDGYITITSNMMTREGYEFLGYYDANGILVINESGRSIKLSSSVSLYAKWQASNVTIALDSSGGVLKNEESNLTVSVGSSITKLPVPSKEGYTFLGWENNGIKVSDNNGNVLNDYQIIDAKKYKLENLTINLEAIYEEINYKVTIDYNDSTYSSSYQIIKYGNKFDFTTLDYLDTGSKYIVGWSTNPYTLVKFDGNVNSNMTIYAIWKEYQIFKLHTNIDDEIIEIKVCNGEDYNLNEFEKDGYIFDGWYTSNIFSGLPIKSISYNYAYTEFYAKTSLIEYTIEFISNGGSEVENISYTVLSELMLPSTELLNYELVGWCINEDLSDTPILKIEKGTSNITKLYAKFKGETKYITLNADGGTLENNKIGIEYGTDFTLPVPVYDQYEFKGWFTDASSKGIQLTDENGNSIKSYDYDENINLFAHYRYINSIDILDVQSFLKIQDNPTGIYNLLNDINLTNVSWTPFDFKGTIYGNNYTISNLTYSSSSGNVGTFLTMSGKIYDLTLDVNISSSSIDAVYIGGLCSILSGTVDNITITGNITGVKCSIGGLAGQITGTVTNCVNKATIKATPYDDGNGAGGICAHLKSGTITSSVNYGTITGKVYTAGIIGLSESINVSKLSNYGNVTGTESTAGIIGKLQYNNNFSIESEFYNEGNITGTNYVGGIYGTIYSSLNIGYKNGIYYGTISNQINVGNITGSERVGGIIGYSHMATYCNSGYSASFVSTFNNFKNEGNITGKNYVGGLGGYWDNNSSSSILANSSSRGTITGEARIGGLGGEFSSFNLKDSTNEGTKLFVTGYILDGTSYCGYIGGYAGLLSGTISNCHNNIDITYNERGSHVGGIVGELTGTMNNCSNSGTIYAPKSCYYIGGLIGNIWQSKVTTLENLTNTGDVTGLERTGGIIGNLATQWNSGYSNSITTSKLNNLKNSGNITGTEFIGGIIGHLYGDVTCNSGSTAYTSFLMNLLTNTGDITGKSYIGGLIGKGYSDGNESYVTISKSSAKITAEAFVGGLAGHLRNIAITDSSNENSVIEATGFVLNGTSYEGYIGGYVGSGYTISGCTNDIDITYNERGYCVGGLAGYLSGNIKNSTNNGNIYAPKATSYVGGLVGDIWIATTTTLENLINTGDVTGLERTGGIVGNIITEWNSGYSNSITTQKFTNLKNSGNITGTSSTGGIIGYLYGNVTCNSGSTAYTSFLMNMLVNTGNVTGSTNVGGLIGYGQSDGSESCISISSSSGVIIGVATVGGLAGKLQSISIDECSNEGTKVEATGYNTVNNINYADLGGYVGCFLEPAKISNCTNNIDITYNSIGVAVGGLIGNSHGSVENCLNNGNVYAPKAVSWVGGIAGRFWNGGTLTLTNVENTGKITGTEYTGGITGRVYTSWNSGYSNSTTTQSFTNLKNSGEVVGTNYVAGLIGDIYGNVTTYSSSNNSHTSFIMLQLYNTGKVTGTKYVAGFIGNFYTDGTSSKIEIYENTGEITGSEYVDNLVGNKINLTIVEE